MSKPKISSFYMKSGLFGVLSLGGAVFGYTLYPVLVRVLSPGNFGDFAAITALSNQVLGILLAFNIISIYLVKTEDEEVARKHAQLIQTNLIWFFLAITILLLTLSPYIHHILKINGILSFFVLALTLISAIPATIWTGYLQGHNELVRVGVYNISAAVFKLMSATILAVQFGTVGGVAGVLLGNVIGLLIISLVPGVKLPRLTSIFKRATSSEKEFLLKLWPYLLVCIFTVGSLSFLQNFDILVAKNLFSTDVAGQYSGISIISNALYYFAFLLIWVVLPEIKIDDDKVNRRVLGTAYKLLSLLAGFAILGEFLLRNFATRILLGKAFEGQGTVLILATFYQITLVSIALYAFYLLVKRRRRAAVLAVSVLGSCVGSVALIGANTPQQMITRLWLSLLVGCFFYFGLGKIYDMSSKKNA